MLNKNTEKYNKFAARNGVAIPIIQRDYVQGADVNFEKRDKFIKKLLDALLNRETCELHFIYGSTDMTKTSEPYFQPVDGQQRLTTLALIGWLLNQKCGLKYSGCLKPLTYTSRPSTEQFCKLMHEFKLPEKYVPSISDYIKNVPGWFSESWKLDSSINSMLEFLDKADFVLGSEPYKDHIEDMADTFFNDSPFEFENLDMENLDLNDDLYVKMNARGKLLTPFENWKAEFEDFLGINFKNVKYQFGDIPGMPDTPTLKEYFEYSIEHDWCDMLWPKAYSRWQAKSEEEKKKILYPSIDEWFMNLLDYVSQFLMFVTMPDAETVYKNSGLKNMKDLYTYEIDRSRLEVYKDKENVIKLFRILDLLVGIYKRYEDFGTFMSRYFIATSSTARLEKEEERHKVNLFDYNIDLVSTCLEMGTDMDIAFQIILWSFFLWMLSHSEELLPDSDIVASTDYLRVMTGWVRGRRQRLTNGYSVRANARLADFHEADNISRKLSTATNMFETLQGTTEKSLEDERVKCRLYDKPNFDIIRELSTCRPLYYSFGLLMPSIISCTDTESYIKRFYGFWAMSDTERVQSLVGCGFKGIRPYVDCWFFGMTGRWDYLLTIGKDDRGFDNAVEAFTHLMNDDSPIRYSYDSMAYYMVNYKEFVEANKEGVMRHYFRHDADNEFTVWTIKSPKTKPWQGYNTDPYAYTVRKLYESGGSHEYELSDWSDNAEHGALYIRTEGSESDAMYMECYPKGWEIGIRDKRQKVTRKFGDRFETISDAEEHTVGFRDVEKKFSFDGIVLLDLPGKDRVQTALDFLEAIL
ncbi:DUF262 domain-containing protein [Paraprevotella clara]|uniref:DUF262 domain-containing protein n=1 Tax=Paraprevotella clara TaxID=454154 RepID=UPI002676B0C3|nr:DUF262 domain-containing protein [Paraprevotella clara]